MPIQNVGTLLENLVVAEAAGVLLDGLHEGQEMGFANSFAMPPLSEWRPHSQSVGMSSEALRCVAERGHGSDFLDAMSCSLRRDLGCGPNGALLAGLVAARRRRGLRLWLNDIPDGHYSNALHSLGNLAGLVRELIPDEAAPMVVTTCGVPYPDAIDHLQATLSAWQGSVAAVLGFLDPMRYRLDPIAGPYTRSQDHRRWLKPLRDWRSSFAVHFTGNSDFPTLASELEALRQDLKASGFSSWLEIRRQHYVVSVASQDSLRLNELASRIATSWHLWCDLAGEIKSRDLNISRS